MESKHEEYTSINARFVDSWVEAGWEWGQPIDLETCLAGEFQGFAAERRAAGRAG
jgi:hypothetical protein